MKTGNFILAALLTFVIIGLLGCSSGGVFTAGNVTSVQLQKNNFRIVARNVSGEAEAGYLFGGSFSFGMMTNTFALVRISGTGMLYKEALENLWKNFETANGSVEGKNSHL